MGLDSRIIAIGKFSDLKRYDIFDYSDMGNVVADTTIICDNVANAFTTEQSDLLAEICNVEVWDFNTHKIKSVSPRFDIDIDIGNYSFLEVYSLLEELVNEDNNIDLFFIPDG